MNYSLCLLLFTVGRDRDTELDLTTDEILADGMLYPRDKKDQLEVAIGDGMEFTIHGKCVIECKNSSSLLNAKNAFNNISVPQRYCSFQHIIFGPLSVCYLF